MKCIDEKSPECFHWRERDCRNTGDDFSWESSYDQCMVKNFVSRYGIEDADDEVATQYCEYAFGNYTGIVGQNKYESGCKKEGILDGRNRSSECKFCFGQYKHYDQDKNQFFKP